MYNTLHHSSATTESRVVGEWNEAKKYFFIYYPKFTLCKYRLTYMCPSGRRCSDDPLYYYCWSVLILQYCRHIVEIHCTCIQSDVNNPHTSSPLGSSPVCEGRVHITKLDLIVTNSLEGTQECAVDIQIVAAVYMHFHC